MKVNRFFPNIMTSDLQKSKELFSSLLQLEVEYESDWFIHLRSLRNKNLELGILPIKSEIIPGKYQGACTGVLLTFTVNDVDKIFSSIEKLDCEVLEEPTDQFYGQRRLLLRDKNSGALIDLSSECEPSEEFMNSFN